MIENEIKKLRAELALYKDNEEFLNKKIDKAINYIKKQKNKMYKGKNKIALYILIDIQKILQKN